ncbi:MAG: hypothetical protein M3552_09480 [Planctomycetota bacterium]|nr:hypothetical protein [Planctomycetaceae bacterium]MDQ3330870.1 hypothetical protein [Planctomycetota bacterium]
MSSATSTSPEQSVDLKNRWLAASLALLFPGLGHLYQGRTFKAAIYCVCILGLFFSGQALGEWKVVYLGDSEAGGRFAAGRGVVKRLLQGYAAQFPVGALAWPAVIQSRRYQDPSNVGRAELDGPLEAPFLGGIWIDTPEGPKALVDLSGTVRLEPNGANVRGRFVGTTHDGQPIELALGTVTDLGQKVSANEDRTLEARLGEIPRTIEVPAGARPYFKGAIPRPFLDRYQVPLGDQGEDILTAKLGGRLEIAYVFTWIAGLLNVLAIWDALDGPAYGYGTEFEERKKRRRRKDGESPAGSPDETARRPQPAGRAL